MTISAEQHKPKPTLTDNQKQALATDKNISVTAGAGSGKTTILVERYLKLILEEGVSIREVLAITFTEKAAAEMKERVAREIDNRIKTADKKHIKQLLNLREQFSSAQIATIHGFCGRLLREYAVESQVDPDYNILNELQQQRFIDDTLDELLTRLDRDQLETPFSREDWITFFAEIPPNTMRNILTTMLQNAYDAGRLLRKVQSKDDQALFEELFDHFMAKIYRAFGGDLMGFIGNIIDKMETIRKNIDDKNNINHKGNTLLQNIDELLPLLENELDKPETWQKLCKLSDFLTTNENEPYKSLASFFKKGSLKNEGLEALSELSFQMSRLRNLVKVAPGEFDRIAINLQRRLLTLYEAAAEIYREKKRDAGLLDFEDLQIYALEMLQNPQNVRVREDLRRRYKYVMVDEFQDTNELQWEIISLLGIIDGKLDSGKFFVVGDPKQSIYGFRGADVRVFERVKQQFAENSSESDPHSYSGNVLLKESFRFLPEINTFTNMLFEKILVRDNNEYSVAYEALTTKRHPKADDVPHLELAYFSCKYLDSHNLSEADYVARRISELLQTGVIPGDIAVLLAARTNLSELENAMRKLNVPFRTIKGISFYTRQEIFDVYHLLRFLENPRDDLALAAILRSPLVNISDAGMYLLSRTRGESWFDKLANIDNLADYPAADRRPLEIFQEQARRWQSRRDRLSLSRLLTEIFEESFYQATIAAHWNGDQILANIDKIISTIREVEQRGFVSLSDYTRALKDTLSMAPREGEAQLELEDRTSVKIMTIHSAKGLEFPIVFLPYLNKNKTGFSKAFRIHPEFGIATKIIDETAETTNKNNSKTTPYLYSIIDELEKNKNLAEYKRLFYVGVTRAKNQLYLSASGPLPSQNSSTETPFKWLIEHLEPVKYFAENAEEPEDNPLRFRAVEIAPDCPLLLTNRIPDVSTGNDESGDSQNALAQIETTFRELLQEREAETEERLPTHLRKVDDTPKAVTFSATQLVTFSDNPANYFLRYHQGFFESDYDFLTRFSDDNSLGLLKGKIAHKILEQGLTKDRGEIMARLDDVLFQFEIFDEEQQRDLIKEIPDMLLRFAETDLAKAIFSTQAFHNELSITMSLGDDFFTGTVDRIYKTASGNWEVIDYKTNHITAEAVEQVGKKYEMQIKGYALLMSRAFPGQAHYTVRLYFLNPGKAYKKHFTPAQIEAIYHEFLAIIEEIKRYKPFGNLIPEISASSHNRGTAQ